MQKNSKLQHDHHAKKDHDGLEKARTFIAGGNLIHGVFIFSRLRAKVAGGGSTGSEWRSLWMRRNPSQEGVPKHFN